MASRYKWFVGLMVLQGFLLTFLPRCLHARPTSDSIPIFPDLVYEYRITELNRQTPIELDYNKYVRRYIDVYTIEQRQHMADIAGRAQKYFPLIEQKLDEHQLPLELKYLAIVESALDPFAVSSSGAVGLWQFKLNTSRMFDLEVNSYIDERRDPYKSTEAACDYLQYLYRTYNDWQLALAAYNGGPGVVRKAIKRAGGNRNFWELFPYLPEQTKGYVPAFIAVNYAMNYLKDHEIKPEETAFPFHQTDTVKIQYAADFQSIASQINLPVKTLEQLNPIYRRHFIPNLKQPTALVLPQDKIGTFITKESLILQANPSPTRQKKPEKHPEEQGKEKLVHVVEKGEYFHKIAMKYNCTIEQIRRWNDLPNNNLQVGQKLDIWVEPGYHQKMKDEPLQAEQRHNQADTNKRVVYYTVQEGDTIWKIANKFNCESIADLIKTNDIDNEKDLKPGKRLKIYLDH